MKHISMCLRVSSQKYASEQTSPKVLMCANLHPSLQSSVISQTNVKRVSILDSMNLWIDIANQELREVMTKVDILILNDAEVKMLAGDENLIRAAEIVLGMKKGGILVVKRGEHGVLVHPDGIISMPSYPTRQLTDPTGCGDSFAGAIAQYLTQNTGEVSRNELAESLVHATVTASFTIENFGTEKFAIYQLRNMKNAFQNTDASQIPLDCSMLKNTPNSAHHDRLEHCNDWKRRFG